MITAGTDIAAIAKDRLITKASIAGRAFLIACFIFLPHLINDVIEIRPCGRGIRLKRMVTYLGNKGSTFCVALKLHMLLRRKKIAYLLYTCGVLRKKVTGGLNFPTA